MLSPRCSWHAGTPLRLLPTTLPRLWRRRGCTEKEDGGRSGRATSRRSHDRVARRKTTQHVELKQHAVEAPQTTPRGWHTTNQRRAGLEHNEDASGNPPQAKNGEGKEEGRTQKPATRKQKEGERALRVKSLRSVGCEASEGLPHRRTPQPRSDHETRRAAREWEREGALSKTKREGLVTERRK